MDIHELVSAIEFHDLDDVREKVGKKIKLAMKATGYPQRYFTEEGSEFQETLGLHMNNKGGFSESLVKNFLKGEFGKDKDRKRFVTFSEGAASFFNLQKVPEYLFDETEEEEFLKKVKERWKEKYKVQMQLLKKMEQPGEWFSEKLSQSKRISLSGISLFNTIHKHKAEIETSLKKERRAEDNHSEPGIKECSFRSSKRWAEVIYFGRSRTVVCYPK